MNSFMNVLGGLLYATKSIAGFAYRNGGRIIGALGVAATIADLYSRYSSSWDADDKDFDYTDANGNIIKDSITLRLCRVLEPLMCTHCAGYNPQQYLAALTTGGLQSLSAVTLTNFSTIDLVKNGHSGAPIGVLLAHAFAAGIKWTDDEAAMIDALVIQHNAETRTGLIADLDVKTAFKDIPLVRLLGNLLVVAHAKAKVEGVDEANAAFLSGDVRKGWELMVDYLSSKWGLEVCSIMQSVEGNESRSEWQVLAGRIDDPWMRRTFVLGYDPEASSTVSIGTVLSKVQLAMGDAFDTNDYRSRALIAGSIQQLVELMLLNKDPRRR